MGEGAAATGGHIVNAADGVGEVGVVMAVAADEQGHPSGVTQGVEDEAIQRHLGLDVAVPVRPCRRGPGENQANLVAKARPDAREIVQLNRVDVAAGGAAVDRKQHPPRGNLHGGITAALHGAPHPQATLVAQQC